ncbi:type I toxin-antitoxin system Ibs family toxin [Escherichia coli]|nr:type I toxin-antitoxin system Ibs family toxin [Escherichia coli]
MLVILLVISFQAY